MVKLACAWSQLSAQRGYLLAAGKRQSPVTAVHAESAVRDGLGKGFKAEVVPLNSLLGKLAARQAALEARYVT